MQPDGFANLADAFRHSRTPAEHDDYACADSDATTGTGTINSPSQSEPRHRRGFRFKGVANNRHTLDLNSLIALP